MELNRAVAENIKRIRKTKKLSLERTAALSGVSRSMLSQIERGEANPSVAILGKIAAALKVPAEVLLENDDFTSLLVARELDNTPERLDNGKVLRRISFPYDDRTRQESFFLDLYISARYEPEPSVPGCVCHATVIAGTVSLLAEGETYQLLERDALRFAADQPYEFQNMTNATARLLLYYQYLK
ncbi:MAG: helix-turn-helix domain-containing protein [Oscillibacter sp.]|nr:helix-turn-helix domain-containing protein [Oscillibacter sp.]